MRNLTVTICLTLAVLLGSAVVSWGADFQKGLEAYQQGDYATALREWKPLAELGTPAAQHNLGLMYESGQGVTQNHKEAVKWFREAAEQGVAEAQVNLGEMYAKGRGVTQDYREALKWFRKAAEQGVADAQYNLGVMYLNGFGVIEDYVYAHMWWNLAASKGDASATRNRDIVAKKMTAAQLAEAQKLARECVRKNYKGC